MRIVLVTPPFFVPTGCAAAPAVLSALLREAGHEALAFDVSRFCVERLLTRTALEKSLVKFPREKVDTKLWFQVSEILPYSLEASVLDIQSMTTFDSFHSYRRCQRDIELAMFVHAKAHGGSNWFPNGFSGDHDRTDPYDLLRAVHGGGELLDESIDEAVAILTDFRPSIAAISVSFADQMYGALRIARMIRNRNPSIHICLGGATITRLRRSIPHLPELFDLVDSIILREGETPLVALAASLSSKRDPLDSVTGLFARRGDQVLQSAGPREISIGSAKALPGANQIPRPRLLKDIPFPVFDDLVPGHYLSPQPLMPVSTTRNCYFDKCPFCAISRSFGYGYDEMSANRMAEQIQHLAHQYPGALFKDVSEALPPKLALAFAEANSALPQVPPWEAYFRFEHTFATSDAALLLRRGGLRVAYFGLESGSPRLLGEMNKHIDVAVAERTIRNFAEVGIWNHLFLMAGYATETEEDHGATLEFLRRNGSFIHSVQTAAFVMELDSDIVELGNRHGFSPSERREPSFSLSVGLDKYGDIPLAETAQRRVRELRQVAYGEAGPVLAASRYIWDGHKIVFAVQQGGPSVPDVGEETTEDQTLVNAKEVPR